MALALIAYAPQVVRAQENVPPPPTPVQDGPSLEVTMTFIQDKMTKNGKVSWSTQAQIGDIKSENRLSEKVTKFQYDLASCQVSYHTQRTFDGTLYADDLSFNLRDAKHVVLKSGETEYGSGDGYYHALTFPSVSILDVTGPTCSNARECIAFTFIDEDMANRVRKAMAHAVELCGGSAGAAPPPKPARTEPSLVETMRLIKDDLKKLGAAGYFGYVASDLNAARHPSYIKRDFSSIVVDSEHCRVSYHDGLRTVQLSLRDTLDITVGQTTLDAKELEKIAAQPGANDWPLRFERMYPATLVYISRPTELHGNEESLDVFPFHNDSTANHFAEAMAHAVELCGGRRKEPF